ncbi:MAG: electron transport complex subunit E [Clostridiales bacterium]|nr:electron transport complex subunit E [Clostridiales bacterium]
MKLAPILKNGILTENPTFRLVLGMCPTLAVTTVAINGIGMGLATTFVLMGSNIAISLLKSFIPEKVRIPAYVVIIATFVTMVQLLMEAFLHDLYNALGIFIPLIVVNCIILARAEAFANKHSVIESLTDGLGMGLGFTLSLTTLGSIRELLSNGTIFGLKIMGAGFEPALIMAMAPGGFMLLGLLLALINKLGEKKA